MGVRKIKTDLKQDLVNRNPVTENFVIDSPVGRLQIKVEDQLLMNIELNSQIDLKVAQTSFGKIVALQLKSYFEKAKFKFDLPLEQVGTAHQLKVWAALRQIPAGSVLTYGQLAEKIGSSARAIGNACRNNPLPIVVPCHRIVAASDIGGFSGAKQGVLLEIKRHLLNHEGLSF